MTGCLVGCGFASRFQLTAWASIPQVRIAAVSSRDESRARRRAGEFSVTGVYTDYRRMLDEVRPDFLDIATPPDSHLEIAAEAASRGIHILCQKPLAPSLADIAEIGRVCARGGVRIMVNENGRFQPWFRDLKPLLSDGILGRVFSVAISCKKRLSLPEPTFKQKDLFVSMPRLITYELGTHMFDIARFLLGEPDSVAAHTLHVSPHIAGDDAMAALVRFPGAQAVIQLSWASVPVPPVGAKVSWSDYTIEGEAGTARISYDGRLTVRGESLELDRSYGPDSEQLGYTNAARHFLDGLATGAEFETDLAATTRTMELVFGAYESSESGRIVSFARNPPLAGGPRRLAAAAGGEGPVLDVSGRLYFTEMREGAISRLGSDGEVERFAWTGRPNGLCFDGEGRLWVAESGTREIVVLDTDGRILFRTGGPPTEPFLWPNDLCFGPDGQLYFTDSGCDARLFDAADPPESVYSLPLDGKLWRLDPMSGEARVVDRGLRFANGLAFDPAGRVLYLTETLTGMLYRYRFLSAGYLGPREPFARTTRRLPEFYGRVAGPDGMAVAADGTIVVAILGEGELVWISPTGEILDRTPLPGDLPTNCAFSYEAQPRLFVTEIRTGAVYTLDTTASGSRLFRPSLSSVGGPMQGDRT